MYQVYSAKYYQNIFNKFTDDEVNILNTLFSSEIDNADIIINYNIPTQIPALYSLNYENIPQIPPLNYNYMNYSLKEINNIIKNHTNQYNYKIAASKTKHRAIEKLRYLDFHPAFLKDKLILDREYSFRDVILMPNKFLYLIAKQFNINWYLQSKRNSYQNKKLINELIESNVIIYENNNEDNINDDGIDYDIYENISD